MVRKDAKSPVRKTADDIRTDLRRRFGPVGLDPSDPAVELEIELVAQLARIAEALEERNQLTMTQLLKELSVITKAAEERKS